MREIKFRARWKDTGKPIPDFMDEYILDAINDDIFIVEEYTGLKEKNGKEIYEGDILTADGMYNDEIVFKDGGFNLKGGDCGDNLLYQLQIYGNYKVIGNVYENPELLERKADM